MDKYISNSDPTFKVNDQGFISYFKVWMWTGLISFPFILYWQQKGRNEDFNSQLAQTTGVQACIWTLSIMWSLQ